jgi:hypothetical protein
MGSLKKASIALMSVVFVGQVARADTLAQEVQNDAGPVYNTFAWQVIAGSVSSGTFTVIGQELQNASTPFFSVGDGFNNTFTYPDQVSSPPAGSQNITDIIDPYSPTSNDDNPGTIAINVDAANSANDYIAEYIDLGYKNDQSENTQALFVSTAFLGFGQVGSSNEYWFAFNEGPATFASYAGATIGGLIETQTGGDIKTFVVVPAPEAAFGGLSLLGLLAVGFVAGRRAKNPLGQWVIL